MCDRRVADSTKIPDPRGSRIAQPGPLMSLGRHYRAVGVMADFPRVSRRKAFVECGFAEGADVGTVILGTVPNLDWQSEGRARTRVLMGLLRRWWGDVEG